ncbi:MAG: hypothetical protein ACR2PR_02420 [Pseudohongiellaceae bacterium]
MRLLILLFISATSLHAAALELQIVDEHKITATGEIVRGDLDRFRAFFGAYECRFSDNCTLSLISPGGNLLEGIRLGLYFQEKGIETLVEKDNYCYSACAIAFLGGTRFYATGTGPYKTLEIGALLGFHSYSAYPEFAARGVVLSEAIESDRVIRGIILEYAQEVLVPNLGLLSDITTVASEDIYLVSTIRDIKGLGITLLGDLPQRTSGWWKTVCEKTVASSLSVFEREEHGVRGRFRENSNSITQITEPSVLRHQLVEIFYASLGDANDEIRYSELSQLSAPVFLHVLLGTMPEFPVYRMELERGGGFYYDYCYAFDADYGYIGTVLVSNFFNDSFELITYSARDGWIPYDLPLW